MSALEIIDVVGGYGAADYIIKGISLNVDAQEIVTIIGPNGAGKSTLLKLVCGLLPLKSGAVRIAGVVRPAARITAAVEGGLVFVPQDNNIFEAMSVEENLVMGRYSIRGSRRSDLERVFHRLPSLLAKRKAVGRSLSGGQRQLLAMGIALMGKPRILALDEPTAGLSPIATRELFGLVQELARDGLAVLMVEQNALEALRISDRAIVLVDGRKVQEGTGAEISRDPQIRRLFLGGEISEANRNIKQGVQNDARVE